MLTEEQIARLLDLANLASQKGLIRESRTILDGVLAVRSEFAPALVSLAFTHIVVDDFDGALAILERTLTTHPDDPDALAMKGLAFLLAGRRSEAEEAFSGIAHDSAAAAMARAVMEVA